VSRGKHRGTKVTVVELERKGRSPSTIYNYDKTYRRNIAPTLASKPVEKITTKMLTDLYGEHQRRGLAPRTVYQIHATISSMMTQACRWGWRDSNPAQWAEPPALPNTVPAVPTPDDVRALMRAAEESRRPEYARAVFVAASTGVRRGELCVIRRHRDIDWDRKVLTVAHNIIDLNGRPPEEAPTKNRRIRRLAIDDHTLRHLAEQVEMLERRAAEVGVELDPDPFVFSDSVDGSEPWRPAVKEGRDRSHPVPLAAQVHGDLRPGLRFRTQPSTTPARSPRLTAPSPTASPACCLVAVNGWPLMADSLDRHCTEHRTRQR